jgi:predicted dehydrogenase
MSLPQNERTSRRDFMKTSTTVAVGAGLLSSVALSPRAYAKGDDTIRVGLVGAGGRGCGAVGDCLTANPATKLVAIADIFEDRMQSGLEGVTSAFRSHPGRIAVDEAHRFSGFDAYQKVINSDVDLVILATPPGFRPYHFEAAVSAGKNIFMEKPLAVDGPGVRRILAANEIAKAKNLKVGVGLQRHHQPMYLESLERIHNGEIGDVVALRVYWNGTTPWDPRKTREQCKGEMEYQLRNWYYYCWLSGDHIVEQAVHGIDTIAWVMRDKLPLRCFGVGGRQSRTDPKYGNIWDHFSIVYEFPDNIRGYHQCRHWVKTDPRVKDYILGTKGTADVFGNAITGANKWHYRGPKTNMYQVEHDEMFAALRAGKPINNGEQAAWSTLLALMGRTAAYTGEIITPDKILTSKQDLSPPRYDFGTLETPSVPVPGTSKFA